MCLSVSLFFFFKQKTAYEMLRSLVGSEMCIRDSLKTAQPATHSEAAILEYLARRHKQIDALVISGGEPSLRAEEIIGFCHRLKTALPNLLIKVDTNGSNPLFLQEGRDVFDYVAMDVKSLHYDRFSTTPFDTILQSLDLLDSYPRHEVRVTVYPPYLPETDFEELGRLLKDKRVRHVTLQQYRPVDDIPPYPAETLHTFATLLQTLGLETSLRT